MSGRVLTKKVPLEQYRETMRDFPIVTVDVIFLNADRTKVLLGRRTSEPHAGKFYSFGGRLYKNEDLKEAACRIAQEEVGITLAPRELRFAGVLNEIDDNSKFEGINYHAVDLYFGCVIGDVVVSLDPQNSEARWFDVNDATHHPYVREKIAGALRAL